MCLCRNRHAESGGDRKATAPEVRMDGRRAEPYLNEENVGKRMA